MTQAVFKLVTAFLFGLLSCHSVYAKQNSEIAHLSGLLLASPKNQTVADELKKQTQDYIKKNGNKAVGSESQVLIGQAAKAFSVHQIQKIFDQCFKNSSYRHRNLAQRILSASKSSTLEKNPCDLINELENVNQLKSINNAAVEIVKNEFTKLTVKQSQKNLAKSLFYWDQKIDHGKTNVSVDQLCKESRCTQDERKNIVKAASEARIELNSQPNKLNPESVAKSLQEKKKKPENELSSQEELLLFTSTLKNKNQFTKTDILTAQSEISDLMKSQFQSVKKMNLVELVQTNPAAVGQVLLDHPEWTTFVCDAIEQVIQKEDSDLRWQKIYFWGGLAVGGTLLATGLGAAFGAITLSEVGMATLVVSGATYGVSDALYSLHQGKAATSEASALRASFLSSNGDQGQYKESEAKVEEAYDHYISAGIGAASVVPFGAIWKFMSKSAQASKVGGLGQVSKISAKENEAVLMNLEATLKEISDPKIKKALLVAKSNVSEEDFGSFLGQLSQVNPEARTQVLDIFKTAPTEKIKAAIEKGAQAGREACQ